MKNERRENSSHIEFERRFAILYLPEEIRNNLQDFNPEEIEQGYLADGSRLRKTTLKGGTVLYFETRKTVVGSDGIARKEKEKPISEGTLRGFWKHTMNARVYKTRYFVPIPNLRTIELDIFRGIDVDGQMVTEGIEGRMLGEIESKKDRKLIEGFDPSTVPWLGHEVTKTVSNRKIALRQVEIPLTHDPRIMPPENLT